MCIVRTDGLGVSFISVASALRSSITRLIKDFETDPRRETEWAREVYQQDRITRNEISSQIELAIMVYCPEVPDEYVALLIEMLTASMSDARRHKGGAKARTDRQAPVSPVVCLEYARGEMHFAAASVLNV